MDPLVESALVVAAIAAACAILYGIVRESKKRGNLKKMPVKAPTKAASTDPNVVIIHDKPEGVTDQTGSFMWFWVMVGAELLPVVSLAIFGVNIAIVFLYFGLFPVVAIVAAYFFRGYRVGRVGLQFSKDLKNATIIALHIGTDDKARILAGRRGATGRLHFPNMKIYADSIHKALFPFYGNVLTIIHSVLDSNVNPEFLYLATLINANSEKIGGDGRRKLSHEISDVIEAGLKEEKELEAMKAEVERIDNGETTLAEVILSRYHDVLYPDGVKLDTEQQDKLTEYWQGLVKDKAKMMDERLEKVRKALKITVDETNYTYEFEHDTKGNVIGGHLIHHRIIDLHDFRNYYPGGGTAESAHLQAENERLAGIEDQGGINPLTKYGPWLILAVCAVIVMVGLGWLLTTVK